MSLCLSASRIYNTFSISTRSRKKQLGSSSISFLVHPGRSPGILLCLSASRIYNTFSISTRSRKKQLGSCSISFLVHPGGSPGMLSLYLSASRIYNTFSISNRNFKKKLGSSISFLVHPGRSPGIVLRLSSSGIYGSSLTGRKNKLSRSFCRRYLSVFVCVSNVIDFIRRP